MMGRDAFAKTWTNQSSLGEKFGLTAIQVGKILQLEGLKDRSGQATSKAIQEGYAKSTPLKSGRPFFMWHVTKVQQVLAKHHVQLSDEEFWYREVRARLVNIDREMDEGSDKFAYMLLDYLYDDVPKSLIVAIWDRLVSESPELIQGRGFPCRRLTGEVGRLASPLCPASSPAKVVDLD
ncbi:MAG: hypothetical protein ACOYKZ_04610 [Chlamydiia bacterium]